MKNLDSIIREQHANIHGIVAMKDEIIIHESYFKGYGPEDRHHVASVTKSIVSALVGIAVDHGSIPSIDMPLKDLFPEYDMSPTDVTIRHLLTMAAPHPFPEWQEPFEDMCSSGDWVGYILGQMSRVHRQREMNMEPVVSTESTSFKYASANAHLLSAILTRQTGMSTLAFANRFLFERSGMNVIADEAMTNFGFEELFGSKVKGWVKDPSGIHTGGWGLTLTARDMTRFGQLYLNGGKWGGAQVIPEDWVRQSTVDQWHDGSGYGFMWWIRRKKAMKGIGDAEAFMALGDGGNVICVVPECGMVVAIASGFKPDAGDRWDLISDHILGH